jgi:hypothetical protein
MGPGTSSISAFTVPGGKPRRLQPERVSAEKWKFFTWIRRNPLKSPDSAKEKQGNPSFGGIYHAQRARTGKR